ncbi:MAG: energy transducer TonB [Caulobacteraceae bacterium]
MKQALFGLLAAFVLTSVASAEPARDFMRLEDQPYFAVLLDLNSIVRTSEGAQVDVLELSMTGSSTPPRVSLERMTLDCEWRTARRVQLTESDGGARASGAPAFVDSRWHPISEVLRHVCEGGALKQRRHYQTVDAAIEAFRAELRAAPIPVSGPREPPPPPSLNIFQQSPAGGMRLVLAAPDNALQARRLIFIDWSRRTGDTVNPTARLLLVLRPEGSGDQTVALRTVRVDCRAKTVARSQDTYWTSIGEQTEIIDEQAILPLKAGSEMSHVVALLCDRDPPSEAGLANVDDAVAYARRIWALKTLQQEIAALPPPAPSPSSATEPAVITRPNWVKLPTGEDLARLYPPAAEATGLGGRATIVCWVTDGGALRDCEVVAEDPPGNGFGQAALGLAASFQMAPQMADGAPVGGAQVRIPLVFRLPE